MTATEAILNYATMQGRTFHRKDLLLDVARRKEDIRVEAIDLQINRLIASGMLRRVGHGEYELTDNSLPEFVYRPSEAEKEIFGKLKRQFPFLDFCIWSPEVLASFMLHVPNIGYTFVDVEKDGMESVFNALQGMEPKQEHPPFAVTHGLRPLSDGHGCYCRPSADRSVAVDGSGWLHRTTYRENHG